jgi:D-alanine-D-alanine ligase
MQVKNSQYGRIGVLAGGPSNEREISLRSGRAVYDALVARGLDAILIEVGGDIRGLVSASRIDTAFIALHGRFGEDGTVQGILDKMRVPYTGSGAGASALAIDKIASKEVFMKAGIPVPRHVVFDKTGLDLRKVDGLGLPVVVKPSLEGSSIGLSVVRERSGLEGAVAKAFEYGERVLAEEYIAGRELTVGILDDKPLPVIEIVTRENVYDYNAKYSDPATRYLVPAPVDDDVARRAQALAELAHRALGCRCFSRIDMMLDRSGSIFVLEANTIPGMTQRSLLPKAAAANGLSFGDLCVKLIDDALKGRG